MQGTVIIRMAPTLRLKGKEKGSEKEKGAEAVNTEENVGDSDINQHELIDTSLNNTVIENETQVQLEDMTLAHKNSVALLFQAMKDTWGEDIAAEEWSKFLPTSVLEKLKLLFNSDKQNGKQQISNKNNGQNDTSHEQSNSQHELPSVSALNQSVLDSESNQTTLTTSTLTSASSKTNTTPSTSIHNSTTQLQNGSLPNSTATIKTNSSDQQSHSTAASTNPTHDFNYSKEELAQLLVQAVRDHGRDNEVFN